MTLKYKNATDRQIIAIMEELTKSLEVTPDGYCKYINPKDSDLVLAQRLGPGYTKQMISGRRRKNFGEFDPAQRATYNTANLPNVQKAGGVARLTEEIEALRKVVTRLADMWEVSPKQIYRNGADAVVRD